MRTEVFQLGEAIPWSMIVFADIASQLLLVFMHTFIMRLSLSLSLSLSLCTPVDDCIC